MEEAQRKKLLDRVEIVKSVTGLVASGVNRPTGADRTYEEVRRALLQTPELKVVLPNFLSECHTLDDFWALVHTKFGLLATPAQRRDWVRQQFLPVLDALENDRLPAQTLKAQQFFAPGTQHDGFVAVRELIATVGKSILIADNFVDQTLWPLLTNLPNGASIRILTRNLPPDFGTEARKFAKQYGITVEVRTTDTIHDRFVFCDDKRCWHLGASIKDFGVRAALISEVTSPIIASAVHAQLEAIWQASKPVA